MIHRHQVRVYWEDTDAGGIVYHSNYLNFAERGRTEMVRSLGLNQSELAANGGCVFAVRHMDVDFKKPARLDDLLEVESALTSVGGASMEVVQVIRRLDDGAILVRLDVRLAFISLDGKPVRIPADLRNSLQALVSERR
ncbi:MAG: tol-pal system-associated acyl-CoA thioesterase [Magnetospirillum sp.]|nr:tol-pal system-associated acyl-CoA thioesterase [Magnetospirillum sp.]